MAFATDGPGETTETPPRFCPRCRRGAGDGARLCPDCGETCRPQGYCPICERYWLLPPGSDCPKHDLPLDERRPSIAPPFEPGEVPDWVTVGRFVHPSAAEGPRLRLEAEGIPTFLEGERMGHHGLYQAVTGGAKLQVPRPLAQDARVLLSQSWASPISPDEDLDDAWEELAPEPGASRRMLMRAAIVLVLIASAIRGVWLLFHL